jgi:hypothetical protein
MATTPNFNWSTPDNTGLVKNGALDIRTLGNAIDASMVDLKGGTTGQVLAKASGTDMDFSWVTDATGIPATIFDAKGDIIAATAADTASRLAVGANNTVLTADSSTATGLKWASPAGGGGMTLLSTTTISGDTTVSSIDQTYTNLFVTVTGLTNATGNNYQQCRINASAGSVTGSYYGVSTTSTLDNATSVIYISGMTNANYSLYNDPANVFTLIFNNYASTTTHKTWSVISGYINSSSVRSTMTGSGDYHSNTAISSLQFKGSTYALNGGTIKVYGVK